MDLAGLDLEDPRVQEWRDEHGLSPVDVELVLKHLAARGHEYDQEPAGSFREFIESPHYMDAKGTVWPEVVAAGEELTSGKYTESVLTGSIGSAKTTLALYVQAYELHKILCLRCPQEVFGLDPATEIEIVFQSLEKQTAIDVDYERFRAMIEAAPWFREWAPFDPALKSKLKFPKRVVVKPIKGVGSGAIGQNVIGGILDEVNFMAQIEESKRAHDGGTFDQAVENYNAIASRRGSRFMERGGHLPGMLCLVSSRRFRGQFTDRKEEEARTNPRIYIYDRRVWEVRPDPKNPQEMFPWSGWFWVYKGTETTKPYLCKEGFEPPEERRGLYLRVPLEFRPAFEADLLNALRDIGGVSTSAIHPFIMEPEKVKACFGVHPSIFSRESCNFEDERAALYPAEFVAPEEPRWVHIDLAATGDSCGLAVGYVKGFTQVVRVDSADEAIRETELLPIVHIDGVLEIKPPTGGEIQFENVRKVIYAMKRRGLNIKWVTLDTWQSTDTRQILRRKGFRTGVISLDKDTLGYDITKQALYDGRVEAPEHKVCVREFVTLEKDAKKGKIDHRAGGSKDCSDAVAGVVSGLSRRREVWYRWGILGDQIPASLKSQADEADKEDATTASKEAS